MRRPFLLPALLALLALLAASCALPPYNEDLSLAQVTKTKMARISSVGPDGDPDYDASYPAVAYNSTHNQYLVVWSGEDETPPLVEGEEEIFGQRLYADGGQVGPNDFRLSDMGPDGDTN